MAAPPRRLYLKLYLSFLGILSVVAVALALVLFATARKPLQPPAARHGGTRLLFHLARTLSGLKDPEALRDAVQGVHEDFDLDLMVLGQDMHVRAAAGAQVALPPDELLQRGRRAAAWVPPNFGTVVVPMDEGVLLVRFPGVTLERRRLRGVLAVLAAVVASALALYPLSRSITRPLDQLAHAAEAFGKGDLSARSGVDRGDEVGQLARTFDEMAERIQATRRAERELLANVSHELRTPLQRMQVALELIPAPDEPTQRRVAAIREEVEELSRLVGDVLTTSKLELSAHPLQRRELSVRELAERARERALTLAPSRPVVVDVPEALSLSADEELLARVLDNLIDNARKYDPGGKPIRIEGRREGAEVVLAVQDGGPGIPPEDLGSVFEPFFRGGNARSSTSGFGLGLALARRVAQAHGGTLRAANAASGGARLELRLPYGVSAETR